MNAPSSLPTFRSRFRWFAIWLVSLGISSAQAAIIWTNPITDANPSAANPFTAGQTVDPNVTVSGIGRGAGVSGNAGSNRYNATSWSTGAIDLSDYFTFTITVNAGYELDLTDFVYTAQRSTQGPTTFAFRSSVDSFGADIGTPTSTGATIDLSASAFQNLTAPIEFRLYGFNATSGSGTFSVNDFTFNGLTTSAVPEPSTYALLGIGLVGLFAWRGHSRRRSAAQAVS